MPTNRDYLNFAKSHGQYVKGLFLHAFINTITEVKILFVVC